MKKKYTSSLALTTIAFGSLAVAQDENTGAPEVSPELASELNAIETLSPLEVIGGKEKVYDVAGAAAYLDAEDWRTQGYTNVNRILARVPGVYTREEDGSGNFPNISIRGADGTRSEKVTLMEDGILQAPAPYSAPAAYYSPRAARMSGLEILKGSSQIKYGPQTTAGAINYLSTRIPGEGDANTYWRSTFGSDNTFLNHVYHGDTMQSEAGTFGYLFEVFHEEGDGFRDLDGGGDTGFEVFEPMVKFFWEPNTSVKQRFEFKYGYTDLDADETYVGLSEADFAANPFRRYAGTQFDNMQTEQNRSYLKWIVEPNDDLRFETTVYYNDFARNWYKIRGVDVTVPADVALLDGSAPGTIGIRANSREYESYGIQFSGLYQFETGPLDHGLEFGARWHKDEIRRFQRDDEITSNGTGPNGFFISSTGAPGSGGNRTQEAEALSLWVRDEISYGNLTVTPGFRYEYVDLFNVDFQKDATNTPTAIRSGDIDYFAPGVGFTYDINDANRVFGGVHQGFALPGPRSILKDGVDKEESLGYELGIRHRQGGLNAELVGFLSDFENLIATDAGLSATQNRNVGEAEVWGFESAISYDPGVERGLGFGLPMYVSATWTSAELKTAVVSGGGENIFGGGVDGSEIPYVPEWKLAAGIGVIFEKWGANVDVTYTSSTFGTAQNFGAPVNNQKEGKIDSAFLVDVSGHYQLNENLKLIGGIQNVFDEEILTSRIPLGARAGAPRTAFGGIELTF